MHLVWLQHLLSSVVFVLWCGVIPMQWLVCAVCTVCGGR